MNKRFNLITLAVIAGLAALLFAGIGITSAAAQAAIPGDALYPLKTTLEQTRLSMAGDAGQRAQMKMVFAEQRLDEIAALIKEGRYHEINDAVLSFESGINGALIELDTLAKVDPARAARLAQEITNTLTRYAQTLSTLVASAPEDVRGEVTRALTSTNTASGLEMPDGSLDDNSNSSLDDNSNSSLDDNGNDNSNDNSAIDDHGNDNGSDDNSNANINDDDSNDNGSIDDHGNDNGADDNSNANINDDSGNDNGDDNSNSSINDNGSDDNGNDNAGDDNGGDDNGNDSSGKGGDDNGNDSSGKGGG